MEYFLISLLFPIAWSFIAKRLWPSEISRNETLAQIGFMVVLIAVVFIFAKWTSTSDVHVRNTEITNKTRTHDYWLESYTCNCVTRTVGKVTTTTCQTCYRNHYTVAWDAITPLGSIRLAFKDWESRRVYNEPDPPQYIKCKIGEPASLEFSFTNWIMASPDSLFNTKIEESPYINQVPRYPRVHSYYKMNRVLNQSKVRGVHSRELNKLLNEHLIKIGVPKRVNIIVILTNNKDPMYRYDVENKWIGAKKNDVVLLIGLDKYDIIWTDVISYGLNTGNEHLQVVLRDNIKALKTFDAAKVADVLNNDIKKHYTQPDPAQFEYLEDSWSLPDWAIIAITIISILGSLILTLVFYHNDYFESAYSRYRRNRRW